MVQNFFVPVRLWGLNEIIAARASKYRGSYNKEKRRFQRAIADSIGDLEPMPSGAHVSMVFHEPNKRRDKDNVAAGGCKVILDALVHCGILSDDGWEDIHSLTFDWVVDNERPGVHVTLRSP